MSAPHSGVKSLVLHTTAFPAATAGIIWLSGITHNGIRQFLARGHNPIAKPAQLLAPIANGQLRPNALGYSRAGNDLRQLRRRRSLKMREHFPGSGIDGRKRVDGNGRGRHSRILTDFEVGRWPRRSGFFEPYFGPYQTLTSRPARSFAGAGQKLDASTTEGAAN